MTTHLHLSACPQLELGSDYFHSPFVLFPFPVLSPARFLAVPFNTRRNWDYEFSMIESPTDDGRRAALLGAQAYFQLHSAENKGEIEWEHDFITNRPYKAAKLLLIALLIA